MMSYIRAKFRFTKIRNLARDYDVILNLEQLLKIRNLARDHDVIYKS